MRIGILTLHYARNFGAVLQAYASLRFLRSLGYDAEMVDYRNAVIEEGYRPWQWDASRARQEGAGYVLKYIPTALSRMKRDAAFLDFVRKFLLGGRDCRPLNISELKGYDALLIGSDQVWSPSLTGGFDPVYTGAFAPGVSKVAWAASAKREDLEAMDPRDIGRMLSAFHAVSVREEALCHLLQPYCSKRIALVMDPTLLVGRPEWEEIADAYPVRETSPYVLAYPMLDDGTVIKMARELAAAKGMKLRIISKNADWKVTSERIQWAGPGAFLSWVRGARYVVTSSFHGTAFSLIFGKPFLSVSASPGGRIESLLQRLKMTDRISIGSLDNIDQGIDTKYIEESLSLFRKEAESFLKDALPWTTGN